MLMAKPGYKRAERVADQIRMEVADILARKIKDPRIGFVTVTDVDLSPDLRFAKIYVTSLRDDESDEVALHGLSSAVGFVRGELGRRLELRYTPEIMFCEDGSRQHGRRIDQLLDSLHREDDAPLPYHAQDEKGTNQ
ncbi:MAG: ribosome-binding factor A [Nitrospirales bacterium]|nr:MAG: ribosome-binding factor A [Nitrospirales bacterium]